MLTKNIKNKVVNITFNWHQLYINKVFKDLGGIN